MAVIHTFPGTSPAENRRKSEYMAEESYGLADYSDGQPVNSLDPVCGMEVNEASAAGKVGFWGQTYYFCSENCLKTFEENPTQFVGRQR